MDLASKRLIARFSDLIHTSCGFYLENILSVWKLSRGWTIAFRQWIAACPNELDLAAQESSKRLAKFSMLPVYLQCICYLNLPQFNSMRLLN